MKFDFSFISRKRDEIETWWQTQANRRRRRRAAAMLDFVSRRMNQFNFLNAVCRWSAKLCYRLGLKKTGDMIAGAMVDKNGINRHVLVRYIMKELLLYFLIAFLFFFMVFFVNQILLMAENILKKRVPLMDVIRLIMYSLPFIIAQSAPFATLVGFLMCLGRMMSDNEILILRAAGQGYRIILVPVFILGVIISIISFFVNDYLLPLGTINYNRQYRSVLMSNPAIVLESNSVKRTNDKTLVIGTVDGKTVSDMVFFDTDTDGAQRIIVADKSVVTKASAPGVLMTLHMNNSTVVFFDKSNKIKYDVLNSQQMDLNIFESSFFDDPSHVSPREMTSFDLHRRIQSMKKDADVKKKQLNTYQLEYNKKFSLPFGSIFFAILAMPLAILFGKHNGQTIGLIIGLFISVLYWAMMIIGQIFGSRSGLSGFWTMWLPDFTVGIAGVVFYFRLVRR
jgi:lipopolysaccharide export system permease protein